RREQLITPQAPDRQLDIAPGRILREDSPHNDLKRRAARPPVLRTEGGTKCFVVIPKNWRRSCVVVGKFSKNGHESRIRRLRLDASRHLSWQDSDRCQLSQQFSVGSSGGGRFWRRFLNLN